MKKQTKKFLILAVLVMIFTGTAFAEDIKIGSCIYRFNDAFMLRFRNAMNIEALKNSNEIANELEIADSQNDQTVQNEQVDNFISEGVNALIINPVNRMESQAIIDKAKAANIPVVFINREPTPEMLNSYEKAWYVGARAEESGTQSGQIVAEYFKKNPDADKNHDGKIQFIMLKGENGHQDMILRSKYSVEAIQNNGFEPVEIASAIANWDKLQAMNIMNGFVMSIGAENIEAVISNNDEMALGAVEALKIVDYNSGNKEQFIPVVGVDANAAALEALKKGEIIGTVLNDADNQGIAAVRIAIAAVSGKPVDKSTIGYDVTDGKYVWIPYKKITEVEKGE